MQSIALQGVKISLVLTQGPLDEKAHVEVHPQEAADVELRFHLVQDSVLEQVFYAGDIV